VSFRINFADTALKDVFPTHFQELSDGLIFTTGYITKQVFLDDSCVHVNGAINHCHSVFVMPVVQITLKFQLGTNMKFVPYFIYVMILTTCQMTFLKKNFLAFITIHY
jgi:hypothetical protein